MLRTWIIALGLIVSVESVAYAQPLVQPRYPQSTEPPLADDSIQQAGAQIPARPVSVASAAAPVVIVDVAAPSFVPNGKDIELKLRVENASTVGARDVVVSYQLPKGGRLISSEPKETAQVDNLTWSLGNLPAGARKEIALKVGPAPDMTDWNHVVKVQFEHGRKSTTKIARPEISVKVTRPSAVQQFDIVPMRLEISNPGMMEVRDIVITDVLPDGLTHQQEPAMGTVAQAKSTPQLREWKLSRLGPQEIRYFDFNILADKPGDHTHRLTAVSATGAKHESDAKLEVKSPKIELKVEGPSKRGSHQTATYRVSVRNLGNAPLRNVIVSDRLPAGCDVISASDGGQSFERDIQWILPVLQPGESRVIELMAKSQKGGPAAHSFAAAYRNYREQQQLTTDFEQAAALKIDVQVDRTAIAVGDEVRVSVIIENFGSAPANQVRSFIVLPSSLTFVRSEPPNHRHDAGRVNFDAVMVSPSGKQTYSVTAKAVRAALPAVVAVELESDQLEAGRLRREESIAISDPQRNDR